MRNESSHAHGAASRVKVERGIWKRVLADGTIRYEAIVLVGGRQVQRSAATLRDARAVRADLVGKAHRGERAPAAMNRQPTLGEYAAVWLDTQQPRLRGRTIEWYEGAIRRHVVPKLGRYRLTEITTDDVAALIASMEKDGLAGWTQRGVLVPLSRCFSAAVRAGLVSANPCSALERSERPRVRRRELPALDSETVRRLIAATPRRYRTLVALSVLTGLRQSEALGLRWQDIDTRAGIVQVRFQLGRDMRLVEPKTPAAKREVPIPPSLARMLAEHRLSSKHSRSSDFVFATATGTPLGHRNVVRRGLAKAIETGVMPVGFRWHDLRHVAASLLIEQGASVAYIAKVLGHASPSTTLSIYAHAFAAAEHADRTRDALEAAFGGLLGSI
jgi:integrase